jgi:hypothetical protein
MDPSTTRDPSTAHYEQVCQGLRSFYVCVIEEEDGEGNSGLLAHETSLRHARFEDARKRQQGARRDSKTWIAECRVLPETEMDQDPVTVGELAVLFNAMREEGQILSPWQVNKAKRRVAAWLKQNSTPTPQPF